MEEENNCIIIKYRAEIENDEEERCFVLDEFYSKKFKKSPINELTVSYPISNGYDHEYTVAKLYFIEAISRHTHDEIKRLFLADNEKEDIIDILNNKEEEDEDEEEEEDKDEDKEEDKDEEEEEEEDEEEDKDEEEDEFEM